MRRAEQRLEPLGGEQLGLRQEREDAPAVVVDHDAHEVDAPAGRRQQAVAVVEEGHVADEQRGRSPAPHGHADRGRHDAVDAVGAAVGHDPHLTSRGRVALDVADRHRRRHDQRRPGGHGPHDGPGDGRLGVPVRCARHGPELAVGRVRRRVGHRAPAVEPAGGRRRPRGCAREGGDERGGVVDHQGGRGRGIGPAGRAGHHLDGRRVRQPLVDDAGRARRAEPHDHLGPQAVDRPGRAEDGVEVRDERVGGAPGRRPRFGHDRPPERGRRGMDGVAVERLVPVGARARARRR